ncbi:MAG: polysaccharide biosynthesis C-terminal domain-containing protein, partial [Ruminiclostridium sp.]|nr:polysaccharide biosynthesis C-terminal domain-containing protein [Ruminiclostridium sp.]
MRIQLSDHFTYRKLVRFTIPSIAMMIFTSIYSVVDGFFVSNFAGKTPFAAVNLIMPFLMILSTVGLMFGTGGTALVAKTFGEGDEERANQLFSLFTYTAFVLGIILAVVSFLFLRPSAALLGAEGALLDDCVTYGRIILCALPFFVLQLLFQSFFVAAEKPQLGFIVIVCAGVTNMVLDAVLVMLFPQEYKLAGAAIATAASQTVGGIFPLVYFSRKNNSTLRLGKTMFDGKAIGKACVNGSSEFMSNVSMSIGGMLYNMQ